MASDVIFLAPGHQNKYHIAIAQKSLNDCGDVEWSIRFLTLQESYHGDDEIKHLGGVSHSQSTIQVKLEPQDASKSLQELVETGRIRANFASLCFRYHQNFAEKLWKALSNMPTEQTKCNVLVLGLGAGALLGHILETVQNRTNVDIESYAVEVDSGMVSLATEVFGLRQWCDNGKLKIFTNHFLDAFPRLPTQCFDVIIIDLCGYSTDWPLLAPVQGITKEETIQWICRLSKPTTTISINFLAISSDDEARSWMNETVNKMKRLWSGNVNYLIEIAAENESSAPPRNHVLTMELFP